MKKIAFIYGGFDEGGVEKVFDEILSKIDREKFEPMIVHYNLPKGKKYDVVPIYHVPFPMTTGFGQIKNFYFRAKRTAEIFRDEKPDIIFSGFNRVNVNLLFAKYFYRFPGKIVISEHTAPSAELNVPFASILKNYQYADKPFSHNLFYFLANKIIAGGMKLFYKNADAIVAVSEGIKKELTNDFGVGENRIEAIENPVDVEKIKNLAAEEPETNVFNENAFNIVSVGRLERQKGFDILIEAFAEMEKKTNAELYIIGEGSARAALEKQIKERGLSDKAFLLGFRQNPYQYMSRADLFVLSSRYEGFGLVIVEAMICGTPVVSADCPSGPNEIIIDGYNGLLTERENPAALAETILKAVENEKLRERLKLNALSTAMKYDSREIVKIYERLFDKL